LPAPTGLEPATSDVSRTSRLPIEHTGGNYFIIVTHRGVSIQIPLWLSPPKHLDSTTFERHHAFTTLS